MKKSNTLASLMAFASIAESISHYPSFEKTSINDIDFTPKKAPIPKGCKEYFFDEVGNCTYTEMNNHIVFSCIASNEKNAIRKFSNWLRRKMNHTT